MKAKLDPDELDDIRDELDTVIRAHRDVLNRDPRILRPLMEARDAAKTKYDDLQPKRDQ